MVTSGQSIGMEFTACTKPDPEVQQAMKNPVYIRNHFRALLNYK
jgi:hypothetical protein